MNPSKAADPDGFSAGFYQSQWNKVKSNFMDLCKENFSSKVSVVALNHTHISLIPKIQNAKSITHFRPILSKVTYKIFSKIIVNRIKPYLSSLISNE